MGWLYLFLAIIFEIFGTSMMKLSNGLSVPIPTIFMFVGYIASFVVLSLAIKTIDISVAYAIWSGVGIVLISLIGFFVFGETFSFQKLISIIFIVVGVVSLRLCTN